MYYKDTTSSPPERAFSTRLCAMVLSKCIGFRCHQVQGRVGILVGSYRIGNHLPAQCGVSPEIAMRSSGYGEKFEEKPLERSLTLSS